MKIFVNARFLTQPVSGVQRYGIECSRQIKKLHPEVTFVAPRDILHENIAKELNVTIVGSNTGQRWEQLDLTRYLAKHNNPPLLNLANTAPLFYRNNFITIHDLAFHHHPEWNSKAFSVWYNFLIPRLARRSRHIFTVSNTVGEEIARNYKIPPDKISVAYNGVSQKMLDSNARLSAKEKIILSVGTFNIRKNHPKLIAGFLGSDVCRKYSLVLIGDKNKVFKDVGIDEQTLQHANIKIYATLSEDELIAMYQRAEMLVSLSLYEGFGIPVLEGLYNGCKVICSDIPVYRELYDGYVSFCNPLSTGDIAGVLNSAANSGNTDQDISALLNRYNYERSARIMMEQIFQNTI